MARAAAGYLINRLNVNKFKMMLGTILSYIPEAIFTAIVFVYIYISSFLSIPQVLAIGVAVQILVKAFVEMIIMGALFTYLIGSKGFQSFKTSLWETPVKDS